MLLQPPANPSGFFFTPSTFDEESLVTRWFSFLLRWFWSYSGSCLFLGSRCVVFWESQRPFNWASSNEKYYWYADPFGSRYNHQSKDKVLFSNPNQNNHESFANSIDNNTLNMLRRPKQDLVPIIILEENSFKILLSTRIYSRSVTQTVQAPW